MIGYRQPQTDNALDILWTAMQSEKGDIEQRAEKYAYWTIPAICPENGTAGEEQVKADVAIGPRLVNHLANKIVDTMFPKDRPFFAVAITPEARKELRKELGDEEAAFAEAVREETASVEEAAMRKLQLSTYRPQAVQAARHLVVTGNVIIRRLPDNRRAVYGIRDFCIRRDITGKPTEIMLLDVTRFGGLPENVRLRVKNVHQEYTEATECKLYTHFRFDGSRWAMRQAVDDVDVSTGAHFKPVDLPVLPLAWSLARGENYGRGLVEDHATAFHQIDALTKAMIDMVGVMADIKFLVDPASQLDPVDLNNSPRGSYHSGRKDDISTPDQAKNLEVAATLQIIQGLERELAQAFLLNSSTVRNAERVTAEEIRYIAMELESAFGGLYSRLAIEWQQHEAEYAVSQINFQSELPGSNIHLFEIVVTTGLESLSREGQLDNLRRAIADLQMLDAVPEELRAAINPLKFASFVFTNHTVKWKEFLYTKDEMTQNQEAQMQVAGREMRMQAEANVNEEAGKKAIQES